MSRKTVAITAALICIGACIPMWSLRHQGGSAIKAAQPDRPDDRNADRQIFMREKLTMVNDIVEGLATEDFDLVKTGGNKLAKLAESAAWLSDRDPFYRHYSSHFEQAVRGLLDAADSKSPEKVTFAYVHVTFSCTACHQHVRNVDRVAQ